MTPSELKFQVENTGKESHFFSRASMKFAGDTMRNYGVRATTVTNMQNESREVWELYRKNPVKHGLKSSAYFDRATFARVRTLEN